MEPRRLNGRRTANGALAVTAVSVTDWALRYRASGPASSASVPENRCCNVGILNGSITKKEVSNKSNFDLESPNWIKRNPCHLASSR